MTNLINHLWQSTLFAAAAWGLTLALRRNRAAVRYAVWLAASCKFLIPFSVLVAIGSQFEWRTEPPPQAAQISFMIDQVSRPFSEPVGTPPAPAHDHSPSRSPFILLGIWAAGSAICALSWSRQWRRARAIVRAASSTGRIGGVPVKSAAARIEPGIFGIFRPVLLFPGGIEQHLTPDQIRAIVAHELAHARRRDNLTAAIHMLVETIFWFHPAVWLIRAKLAEERELACDEAVLRESVEPEVYAEGILNVCKFYLEPQLACVSGVSGSDLRKRIEAIMTDRVIRKVSLVKRSLLTAAALASVAGPVAIGLLNILPIRAEERLSFDVVSVKVNRSDERRTGFNFEAGRFVAYKLPLYSLIGLAYDLPAFPATSGANRILGGPAWVRSEAFDVEGKADLPAGLSAKERETRMKLMLRTLLEDRFQLQLRRETKDMPIYALVVAKNGPKLKKADLEEKDCPQGRVDSNSCHVINGGRGRGLHARAADMADVVLFVSNWTDRPFLDKTGLKGLYELNTEGWTDMGPRQPRPDGQVTSEDIAAADPTRPTVYMMFDKLGLKMEGQRGPVEVYTIQHAEQPAAN